MRKRRIAVHPNDAREGRSTAFQMERAPARGFVLLLAGALAGALAVLLVGWPRGETAPVEVTPIKGPTREQGESVRPRANPTDGNR